ncbi:hypothetical protein RQM47_16700, partial [Rubrivirga sp. S365]|uniref:hypothetical protein n=1 Tax=Rubrivirga sp. S365 TaxID=3076080 RepID=UPI0028C97738
MVVVEVTGTLPDGTPAYSAEVLTFVPAEPGEKPKAFRVVRLSEYLAEQGGEPGSLYLVPLGVPTLGQGEPAEAKPGVRGDRYMDADGAVRYDSTSSGANGQGSQGGASQSRSSSGTTASASAAGVTTVNVSGYVYYTDYAGVIRPLPFVEVAVWEDDGNSAFAALNNILVTSSTGYYSTTVSHDDGDGSLELFLEVRSVNSRVRVGNGYLSGKTFCESGNSYCGLALASNQYSWRGP